MCEKDRAHHARLSLFSAFSAATKCLKSVTRPEAKNRQSQGHVSDVRRQLIVVCQEYDQGASGHYAGTKKRGSSVCDASDSHCLGAGGMGGEPGNEAHGGYAASSFPWLDRISQALIAIQDCEERLFFLGCM